MIEPKVLVLLAIMLPFLCAAGVNFLGRWKNLRDIWQVLCAACQIYFIWAIYKDFLAAEPTKAELFEILPQISFGFEVEPLGILYAAIASVLWLFAIIYSVGYLRAKQDEKQTRFFVFYSLSIAASIGIAFASNLISLFIFYEMLTLLTLPLVTHGGGAQAKSAGRYYLIYLLGSSLVFLLPAIAATYAFAGAIDFEGGGMVFANNVSNNAIGFVFLLFVFGAAKSAILPMHKWLPKAMVAPAPVSALLHAVAVVNAGVFVIAKVVVYVFGAANIELTDFAQKAVLYVAAATIIYAGIKAARQSSIKTMLAYSTIANLSYMILGVLLLSKAGLVGAGVQMAAHAIGKITLFFVAGALLVLFKAEKIADCNGLAKKAPILFGCFFLCSLSIIGTPFFAGGISKHLILAAAHEQDIKWVAYVLYAAMALAMLYLLPISYRAFFKKASNGANAVNLGKNYFMQAAILGTTLLLLAFQVYEKYIKLLLEKVAV